MEKKVHFKNDAGEQISGFLHTPEKDTDKGIVLAHCFTCSKHQRIMRKVCDELALNGFLVLRFDFSGNGESEGKFEEATYTKEMGDLDKAITLLTENGVSSLGVMGHSMGAAVSILQSSKDGRVKSLCTIAGHCSTAGIKDIFLPQILERIEENGKEDVQLFGKTFTITKAFIDDAQAHDIKKALAAFDRPYCAIHGEDDDIIEAEKARSLYAWATGEKEIHIIKNADHMFSNEKSLKEVETLVVNWFKKTL